tara:strand:+ start:98083 stop:99219 length:1137 start_codon:yes stop_codon:yes gene_type:complete
MKNDLLYLTSDDLEGRFTGTYGEQLAAKYISERFSEYQLLPYGNDGTYLQTFSAFIRNNPHSNEYKENIIGTNVIGFWNNNARETVVIGAHYDHLGMGHIGSLYDGEKEIHNGADDNASGVSIMINLIPELIVNKDYNFLFIAFSGEELGLYGSSYYVKNPTINLERVRFMINFDMVGRLNSENTLLINGTGTSSKWEKLIDLNNIYNFNLKTTESGMGASDHTSFYNQEIPVLHFFTGAHDDYHKPSDDYEKINFEGMYQILSYVIDIIYSSTSIDNFDFQETTSDPQETPNFTVTLGIMPDYLFDDGGLRIDGVSKGKTASRSGILKGDIIVKMGDMVVTDIMTYMEALSKFNSGDSTVVKVKRDSKEIFFNIIFD